MSKISIDIENVKNNLINIGYEICDCNEKENNGKNWQLKFSNSGAIVTIYDTNNKRNSVVNGKADEKERKQLKEIVDGLKCKELNIDPLNRKIVELINKKQETFFVTIKRSITKKKMIYYMIFYVYQITQKIVKRTLLLELLTIMKL